MHYIVNWLAFLQILYGIISLLCGITILRRNAKYLGNQLLGIGYLTYCIPGFMLFSSHFYPDPAYIIISVQAMIIFSAFGIGFLFLGTRIYFRGSQNIKKIINYNTIIGAIIITIITLTLPEPVIVITTSPVNSRVNIIIGFLILVWHIGYCTLAIIFLNQVRRSALESNDRKVVRQMNFIITGFVLSISAILVYAAGAFGLSHITDLIFFSLVELDLISIAIGLFGRHEKSP